MWPPSYSKSTIFIVTSSFSVLDRSNVLLIAHQRKGDPRKPTEQQRDLYRCERRRTCATNEVQDEVLILFECYNRLMYVLLPPAFQQI